MVKKELTPSLFDSLPEALQGTRISKTVNKTKKHCRTVPKVKLTKSAGTRPSGQKFIDDVIPRKMSLEITLVRVRPTVWRRVVLPSNISLEYLHTIIQSTFGWCNDHLHKFTVGNEEIEPGDRDYPFDADYDSWLVSLDEALSEEGDSMKYLYDFGAGWWHKITLESVDDYATGEKPVIHITGKKGKRPAEDWR